MRRTSLMIGLAGLAPLAIFAATVTAGQLREQGERGVAQAMATAREINAAVDGVLMADAAVLSVLASSPTIVDRDWPEARLRGVRILNDRRGMTDLALIDAATRRQLWSARDGVVERAAPPDVLAHLDQPGRLSGVSGATVSGPGCPCVALYRDVTDGARRRYVITARRNLDLFQDLLTERAPAAGNGSPSVSAIVDAEGRFLARSVGFAERKGRTATQYVQRAIAAGKSGTYTGVTYEGLRNHTTFATSELSGYSTHIAMSSRRFSLLGAGSYGLTLAAIVVAVLVALVAMRVAWLEQMRWRRDQQQAIQSQKMEALGRFAGTVAHDFNNVLQVILGVSELVSTRIADPADQRRLGLMRQAAEKGAALTQQLLQFAREKPLALEPVDVSRLLQDVEGLIARTVGNAVAVEINCRRGEPPVTTNRAGLEMALLNLAANARDAMPAGGTLKIAAGPARRSGYCELTVSDDGAGMPPDVAARALDPFFTTKDVGKGTGLGLAQVQALVVQSHGAIAIESRPGGGTAITLTLPYA